jgi:hypothetical protein
MIALLTLNLPPHMFSRFLILDSRASRPVAERIAFCDGTGGRLFRPETDVELSHWRPNCTPARYRADTSTEMCLNFAADPLPGEWTLAVNNHADVDGILSVYSLLHSRHALAHRGTLVRASEMGDFWGWGELPAQRVFQGVTRLMNRAQSASRDTQTVYAEALDAIPALIGGTHPELAEVDQSLEPLRRGCDWVDRGIITRRETTARLTQYIVPQSIADDDMSRATAVPEFNEPISDRLLFWPQVRARLDRERCCLVSVESPRGWHHDLYAPGYLWADTSTLWTIPGLRFHDGMQSYDLDNQPFLDAVAALNRLSDGLGQWICAASPPPHGEMIQQSFPLILRFVDSENNPLSTTLDSNSVAATLAPALG